MLRNVVSLICVHALLITLAAVALHASRTGWTGWAYGALFGASLMDSIANLRR